MNVVRYDERDVCVVQLTSPSASLSVTRSHLIVTENGNTFAYRLQIGHVVALTGSRAEPLIDVGVSRQTCSVFEFAVCPDEPIDAFQMPSIGIASRSGQSGQGHRRTRRPGMNLRLERQQMRRSDQ